jgi:transposase
VEKKSLRATEQDSAKRVAWRAEVNALVNAAIAGANCLKFIDESACHLGLTRAYGWAKKGKRCCFTVPGNTGPRRTMVALFTLSDGIAAYRTQKGSLKADDFQAFVEGAVVPHLLPGDVVILDNAACHRGKRVRALIEAVGARLLFLPPYSPDFSPIEFAWRKVKADLREVSARTADVLLSAIDAAMPLVTARDAEKFYAHCGYPAAEQRQ